MKIFLVIGNLKKMFVHKIPELFSQLKISREERKSLANVDLHVHFLRLSWRLTKNQSLFICLMEEIQFQHSLKWMKDMVSVIEFQFWCKHFFSPLSSSSFHFPTLKPIHFFSFFLYFLSVYNILSPLLPLVIPTPLVTISLLHYFSSSF